MRIAILADPVDEQYAGPHMYAKELIAALKETDSTIEFVFVHSKPNPFFDGTEHYVVPYPIKFGGYPSFRLFVLIPRLLRKLKVDAVWELAHFGPFNLPKSIKRITTIHDLTPILFPQWHTFLGSFLQKLFLPRILRQADMIISVSKATENDLYKVYPFTKGKVHTILLGKSEIFKPTKDISVLERYQITKPYFLRVGTLEPRKNTLALLEAYDQFRSTGPAYQLVIVGKKGWKYESIVERIEQSPYKADIVQTSYVARDDLPALYSQAFALVFPSFYEGFGMPVLEAMACGTPCIVSNTSSLPEVGGDAVLYIDPQDPVTICQAMKSLVEDPQLYVRLQQTVLQRAALFSWSSYSSHVLPLLSSADISET